jgi:hypothetical protein
MEIVIMSSQTIVFPDWVAKPKRQTRRDIAVKRLQYIVMNAALQRGGAGNISTFAKVMGMERCTISTYIKHGRFSHPAAALAESVFGADLVKKEWLTDPLDIDG